MAVSWRITVFFPKMPCWNPYFYSVFGVRAFWAKLSKKVNFWTTPPKKKLIDNWKSFSFFWGGILVFFTFSLCVFLFFCWFCFLFFFISFLLCFLVVSFFPFLSLLLIDKNALFSPRKGHFLFIFWVSPFVFSLAFFGLPLFQFLFLCLSLSLSLLFYSFFFPSCLSFCSFFLSLSFPFFLLCLCLMKGTTSKH